MLRIVRIQTLDPTLNPARQLVGDHSNIGLEVLPCTLFVTVEPAEAVLQQPLAAHHAFDLPEGPELFETLGVFPTQLQQDGPMRQFPEPQIQRVAVCPFSHWRSRWQMRRYCRCRNVLH